MKKICNSSTWFSARIIGFFAFRYSFILLLVLADPCFGWQIRPTNRVEPGWIRLHYRHSRQSRVVDFRLEVNHGDAHLFVVFQDVLTIAGIPVNQLWLEAWQSPENRSTSGVFNSPIYPPAIFQLPPFPPAPQPVPSHYIQAPMTGGAPAVIPLVIHQQQMAAAMQEHGLLTQQVDSLQTELSKYQQQKGQVISQTRHQSSLKRNTEAYTKQLRAKEETISELKREIESLTQSLWGATAPGDDEPPADVTLETNFEELLAEKDKAIEDKQSELERLQQALRDKEALLEQESKKVSERDTKLECLECEKNEARKSADNARKESEESKQKAERLKAQVNSQRTDHKTEIERLIEIAEEKQEELSQLQAENERLNQQLTERQKAVEKLQQEAEEIERQLQSLREQAKHSDERARELDAEREQLNSALKEKEAELESERKKVKRQKIQLETKVGALKAKEHEVKEFRSEADRLRGERKEIRADRDRKLADQKEKHQKELQAQREKSQQQKSVHDTQMAQLRREREEEKKERKKRIQEEKSAVKSTEDKGVNTQAHLFSGPPPSAGMTMSTATAATDEKTGPVVVHSNTAPQGQAGSSADNIGVPSITSGSESITASVNGNESPVLTGHVAENQELTAESAYPQILDQVSMELLTQRSVPVKSIGGQCGPGGPGIAGDIDMGDFNLDNGRQPAGNDNKRKRKPRSRHDDNQPNHEAEEENAPAEDIGPSTIASAAAEVVKFGFQVALPYLFPVAFASFFSGIFTYRWMQSESDKKEEELEAYLSNQFNDTEEPDVQDKQIETGCDWLGTESKLHPLCLHLLDEPDRDTVTLLVLLHNISTRYPETLMYPVFSWGYWTDTGSLFLNFKELLQRIQSASLGHPFAIENLYLNTLKLQNFYLEPVARQALVLRWLVNQWHSKPHPVWNEFSMMRSPQQVEQFPALLGVAVFGWALESKHEKVRQQLEKRQVKALIPKLLTLIMTPNEGGGFTTGELILTLFELHKDKPLAFWGQTLDTEIEDGRESGLLSGCNRVSVTELKKDCLRYLMSGTIWKAKVISVLERYLTGALPLLDFSGTGDVESEYPQISEQQRIATINFLFDWVDSYHDEESFSEKLRFIRAVLVLAGIYNYEFQTEYVQLLHVIWHMQKEKYKWTDRIWAERLQEMQRISRSRNPELIFKPLWQRKGLKMSLVMVPEVPGEELPGDLKGFTKELSLPANGKDVRYLYLWSGSQKKWLSVFIDDPKQKVVMGTVLRIFCGSIYGVGASENQLEMYFAYNKNCKLRRTLFNAYLRLPD